MSHAEWSLGHSGAFDEDFHRLRDKGEWGGLDRRSLLLTGGTGFFGLWMVEFVDWLRRSQRVETTLYLLTRDHGRVVSRHPIYRDRPWIRFLDGDIRAFEAPSGRIDYIIHGATDTSAEAGRNAFEMFDVIYQGTRRTLEVAKQRQCRRLLLISSGAVYGVASMAEKFSETRLSAPDVMSASCAYGEGKRVSEALGTFAASDALEVVTARCFAFVGAGLPLGGHFAIGNFIRNALENQEILLNSTGKSQRSYLYAADLAVWLMTLLLKGRPGRSYNVGSDQMVDVYSTACLVRDELSPDLPVRIADKATDSANSYYPDIDRARAELGLDAWTPLNMAIRRTAEDARRLGPFRRQA